MNILITGIIIFIIFFLTLRYLANISTKKLSFFVRITIFILFLVLAVLFALGGRFILSLPLALISIGLIKLKGLTVFQIFQLVDSPMLLRMVVLRLDVESASTRCKVR